MVMDDQVRSNADDDDVSNKHSADEVAADDPHKTEKLFKLKNPDMDPNQGSD
jgi:hypothetical protein